jgi:hypothetical protein
MIFNHKLKEKYRQVLSKYPYLTEENFLRIMILYYGINYLSKTSFPDSFTRIEIIFSLSQFDSIPLMSLLRPNSPFTLIDSGTTGHKVLLYQNHYVMEVLDYQETINHLNQKEPFYFIVQEADGRIVLKLNPIQFCYFYRPSSKNKPCLFCFRNDCISRYENISAEDLLKLIYKNESKNGFKKFQTIGEVSITTGTYGSESKFFDEMQILLKGIKTLVPTGCRITIGSHEIRSQKTMINLKKAGATDCTIPLESVSDSTRKTQMKNTKGAVPFNRIFKDIQSAIKVFGSNHVIVRLIAGLGDSINHSFIKKIKKIAGEENKKKIPLWNINVFMPFTHKQYFDLTKYSSAKLNYLFNFCSIINQYVPFSRFVKFKISP